MIGRNLPESEATIPRIRTVERGEETELPGMWERADYEGGQEEIRPPSDPEPWDVDDEPSWAKDAPIVTFLEPRDVYRETMDAMGLEEL